MPYKFDIDQIESTLLARNYQTELFGDLNQFKQEGGQYKACCPFHNDNNPSFSISADDPVWHCHGCGEEGSWIQYLEKRNGLTTYQAIEFLAKAAGITKQENGMTNITETAMKYFQEQLEHSASSIAYLKDRGFTEDEFHEIGVGHNPGYQVTLNHLLNEGFSQEEIDTSLAHLKGLDDYEIAIPYYDPEGNLKSIWGRYIPYAGSNPFSNKSKYLPFTNPAHKDTLFNLHNVAGKDSVVLVEGFFDALLAYQRGINAVAVIGSSITQKQIDNTKGIEHMILAFDDDEAGITGMEKAVNRLMKSGITSSVIEYPAQFKTSHLGIKDPADWISRKGVESFRPAMNQAENGIDWKYNQIIKNHDLSNDEDREEAEKEMAELISILPDELKEEYMPLAETQFPEIKNQMKSKPAKALVDTKSVDKSQTVPLNQFLKRKFDSESVRQCKYLGFEFGTFPQICDGIDGLQPGFYLLGAETNIGKTACLANMFIDLIIKNPDVKGIYFSLDDSKEIIINRLLGIMTGLQLNQLQRKQTTPKDHQELKDGYDSLIRFYNNDRLDIKDISEVKSINQCEQMIIENSNRPLFVVIDGLYNLMIEGNTAIREMNIERANRIKAIVDQYRIPIITSGELRKKGTGEKPSGKPTIHDIMETSKMAYNSNVVWLLYPKDLDSFADDDEPILNLEFAKNKLSHFRSKIELKFARKTSKIEEI
jgi:DNA primase catalytic core